MTRVLVLLQRKRKMPTVDECLAYLHERLLYLSTQKAFIDPEKSDIPDEKNPYPAFGHVNNYSSLESFKFAFHCIYPFIEQRLNNQKELDEFLDKNVKPEFREEAKKVVSVTKSVIAVLKKKKQ